jgi:tetratricopeptide (TPR) repeat protein
VENNNEKIFISFTEKDKNWAEWIAEELEKKGLSVIIQSWDFKPEDNFALKIDEILKTYFITIAVLSKAYLEYYCCQSEVIVTYAEQNRKLILVRVNDFEAQELWTASDYIDLVDKTEKSARIFFDNFLNKEQHLIATIYSNVAEDYKDNGNYDSALEYYGKALNFAERVWGNEHLNTKIYNNIAEVYKNKDDYDNALEYYDKALNIAEKVLGKEHLDTAIIYSNIATAYCNKANYDLALEYLNKALKIREKILGSEHLDTVIIYNNIAWSYYNKANYDNALEYFDKALKAREKILGKEHIKTAATYNNIAMVYKDKADYNNSLKYYKKALNVFEKVSKEPIDKATICNEIAIVYREKSDYDNALRYYEKALSIFEEVWGEEDTNTATIYNNIGTVYKEKRDYTYALEYYYKALKIREKAFGKEHFSTANTYNNIAVVYRELDDYDNALEYYEKALGIFEETWGKEHPHTALIYNNIATVYTCKMNSDKALEYFDKALKIREKVLGEEHPDIAATYNNMAQLFYNNGDYDLTLKCFNKALNIREKVLGNEHPHTVDTYINIGIIHENNNDSHTAIKYYRKAGIKNILEMLAYFKEENREKVIEQGLLNDLLKNDGYFQKVVSNAKDTDLKKYEYLYIQSIYIISLLYIDERNEKVVAYYTRKNIAEKMLFNENDTIGKFRLNSIDFSNDPKEGLVLLKYLFDDKTTNDEEINPYRAFAGCFTFNHDSLNQFRLYGKENGKECTGISIVFKDNFYEKTAQLATQWLEYDEKNNFYEKIDPLATQRLEYDDEKNSFHKKSTLSTTQLPKNDDTESVKKEESKYALFRCIYIDTESKTNKKIVSVGHKEGFLFRRDGKSEEAINAYNDGMEKLVENVSVKLEGLKKYIEDNSGLNENIIFQLLINLRYLTKHVAFKEEQECRIIKIEKLENENVKMDENKRMYLEYLEIGKYVKKIYFAPNASDMNIFQDRLLNERREIKCIKSKNPFAQ